MTVPIKPALFARKGPGPTLPAAPAEVAEAAAPEVVLAAPVADEEDTVEL